MEKLDEYSMEKMQYEIKRNEILKNEYIGPKNKFKEN